MFGALSSRKKGQIQKRSKRIKLKTKQARHTPLRPDTLPLLPLRRPHRIGRNSEVGSQKEAHAEVLVHEVDSRAVCIDVAAGLYVSLANFEVWDIISV